VFSVWIRKNSVAAYFVLAYAATWAIWLPLAASAQGWFGWKLPYALFYLGSFGPLLASVVMTVLTEGGAGLRSLAGRILKWRVQPRYYAFAVAAPVGLFVLAVVLNYALTGRWPDLSLLGRADYLPYLGAAGTLALWIVTSGLGEETGWRGFALPRLQKSRSVISATLILGLLWAGWHLPLFFFRDTYVSMGWTGFPLFAFTMLFTAMVFTWLYNSTGGSLWIVILFHAIFNWLTASDAGGQYAPVLLSVPVVLWALYVARRYGRASTDPMAKQVA
jgi:membrane protease YdiL (CAAX protease family)